MSVVLKAKKEIEVRFSEVDSLAIVWHGHHIKYFEDGREAFGKKYGLGYMDVYREGYFTPITSVHCDYRGIIEYETNLIIETEYVPVQAAKLIFKYTLLDGATGKKLATGTSEQVFLDKNKELQLINPPFFEEWKIRNGIVKEQMLVK